MNDSNKIKKKKNTRLILAWGWYEDAQREDRDSPGAAAHTDIKTAAMRLGHIRTQPVIWDGDIQWVTAWTLELLTLQQPYSEQTSLQTFNHHSSNNNNNTTKASESTRSIHRLPPHCSEYPGEISHAAASFSPERQRRRRDSDLYLDLKSVSDQRCNFFLDWRNKISACEKTSSWVEDLLSLSLLKGACVTTPGGRGVSVNI